MLWRIRDCACEVVEGDVGEGIVDVLDLLEGGELCDADGIGGATCEASVGRLDRVGDCFANPGPGLANVCDPALGAEPDTPLADRVVCAWKF